MDYISSDFEAILFRELEDIGFDCNGSQSVNSSENEKIEKSVVENQVSNNDLVNKSKDFERKVIKRCEKRREVQNKEFISGNSNKKFKTPKQRLTMRMSLLRADMIRNCQNRRQYLRRLDSDSD